MSHTLGMGVEGMRPKIAGRVAYGGKGPKPKHSKTTRTKLNRGHKIRKFTKRLRRD